MSKYDHFGLEYVLYASPEEVKAKVKELMSGNRIRLSDKDKRVLRVGLGERAKARERSAAKLRERYMK